MKTLTSTSPRPFTAVAQNRWAKLAAVLAVCTLSSMAPDFVRKFQPHAVQPLSLNSEILGDPAGLRLPVSLPNGTDIQPPIGTGYSQLTINNGNSVDAVAKLVDQHTGQTVRFIYVQAGQKVMMDGIDAGVYDLKFALGTDWDEQAHRFRVNQTLTAFMDPFEFDETYEDNQVFWSTWEVTLHPVTHGTARTEPIDESEF